VNELFDGNLIQRQYYKFDFYFLHHDKKIIIGVEVTFMVTRAIINVLSNMQKKIVDDIRCK
jgi:hypothetical protein